jgi:hypothetical protein
MENEDLKVELPHCVLIKLLLLLAFDIFISENVQVLLIGVLQAPVVRFQTKVSLHHLLQVCL